MAKPLPLPKNISSRDLLSKAESIGRLGIWTYDVASGQAHCSSGMHQIIGSVEVNSAFHPSLITRMVHPRDSRSVIDMFSLSLRGTPSQRTFRIVRADRTVRWIHALAEPILGEGGTVTSIVGIVTDVTAQEEAARLLTLNAQRRQGLFDHLGLRMWSVDLRGNLVEGVPASAGYTAPVGAWGDAFEDEVVLDKVLGSITQGAPFSFYHVTVSERQRRREPLLVGGVPIMAGDGEVLEWHGFSLSLRSATTSDVNIRHIEAHHVRAARALLKWSIQALAERARVSVSTVQRLESETHSRPTDPLVAKVVQALKDGGAVLCYGPSSSICLLDTRTL